MWQISYARSASQVFEDPFLFYDSAAQRWRGLVHQYSRAVNPQVRNLNRFIITFALQHAGALFRPRSILSNGHQYAILQVLVGGAAVSLTPDLFGAWHLQPHTNPVYTTTVTDTAGKNETFSRRERP